MLGTPSASRCWMPFPGQETALGFRDMLVMVKLSLLISSEWDGIESPSPGLREDGIAFSSHRVTDLNAV